VSENAVASAEVVRRDAWLGMAAVAVTGAVSVGARMLEAPANPLDEFLPLVCARRLLAGEVPYRDYTTLYTPLMTVLDAGVLSVAPRSLLAARLLFLAIVVLGLLVATRLAVRLSGSERKGAAIGVLGAVSHGAPLWGYALVPATVLVLGAFLASLRGRSASARRPGAWLAASGVLLGLAALARHDVAALGALPIAASVFLQERRARGTTAARRSLAIVLGAAALLPLVFVVALERLGAAPAAWEQLVAIPANLYPRMRSLAWPLPWRSPGDSDDWPSILCIYGPFLVAAVALARIARAWRGITADERPAAIDALTEVALVAVFLVPALVRPDQSHVYAARLAALPLLGLLARAPLDRRRAAALVFALALVVPTACREGWNAARVLRKSVRHRTLFAEVEPRRGLLDDGGINGPRERALAFVATRPLGTRIWVGLWRHDRIWLNDVGFYYDAGALPASRHHELYPLVATTVPVQEEIVRDLERWAPPLVVLSKIRDVAEPNASATTFPVHVLDDYLASRYEVAFEERTYRILRRR
jgi:hypothetical protein